MKTARGFPEESHSPKTKENREKSQRQQTAKLGFFWNISPGVFSKAPASSSENPETQGQFRERCEFGGLGAHQRPGTQTWERASLGGHRREASVMTRLNWRRRTLTPRDQPEL